jgi:hypothetical protein
MSNTATITPTFNREDYWFTLILRFDVSHQVGQESANPGRGALLLATGQPLPQLVMEVPTMQFAAGRERFDL